MSNSYNWNIEALDCYPSSNGQTNVVFNAHWRVVGTDGLANTGEIYSTTSLVYQEGTPFTSFANLTSSQVITWVQDAIGTNTVNAIHSSIDSQITNKQNPPVITPPLPWIQNK